MFKIGFILPVLAALVISGCSQITVKERVEGAGDPNLWKTHKAQVSPVDSWQINGKIGVKAVKNGETQSGSATLYWLQRQDYYDIRLAGPLGRGATRLTGSPAGVELEVANQGRYRAATPEALLEQHLGWQLPVGRLLWWVRGLPEPKSRSAITLDNQGRLASLTQDEWRVQYLSYAQHEAYWLPERIQLQGPDLNLTLVIKQWQPRQIGQ